MAQKRETSFISGVHNHLTRDIYREKMCNPYNSGTPDVWYSANNDFWCEYKFLPRIPQRAEVVPTKLLSALQARWLRERHNEGRTVGVIIGCSKGGVLLCGLDWESPLSATEYNARLLTRKELAAQIAQITTRC